jgi:hypothetical protein
VGDSFTVTTKRVHGPSSISFSFAMISPGLISVVPSGLKRVSCTEAKESKKGEDMLLRASMKSKISQQPSIRTLAIKVVLPNASRTRPCVIFKVD